ncbi:MAG: nuclear transport factor 2 family protein [Janthinobacterium lividum]
MSDTRTLITEAYAAFNRRDIDGALALMTENVSWPKASEGGYIVGKDEIRAYWTRQWKEFDPHVEPLDVLDGGEGLTNVKVHQVVRSLEGAMLSDSEVWHTYTVSDGLIERMKLGDTDDVAGSEPSAAFANH